MTLGACTPTAKSEPFGAYPDHTTHTEITGSSHCLHDCTIAGGIRTGENLFHSFEKFSIPKTTTATFADNGASNILIRVSSEASAINGRIATVGPSSSNLFLLNPRGITFGPDASLSIGGSFFATTAESILFPGDIQFSAIEQQVPLLAITAPIGLQFGSTASSIVNQSQSSTEFFNTFGAPSGLRVEPEQSISLLGGDIQLTNGNITANSGRIFIGSVGANSNIALSTDLIPEYEENTLFKDIYIEQRSILDASGNGAQISLRGQNISILDNSLVANAASGSTTVGSVNIEAEEAIRMSSGKIYLPTLPGESRTGTDLRMISETLTLENGALISGGTIGESDGGHMNINVANSIEIKGKDDFLPSLITTSSAAGGQGGSITINTEQLSISDGGQVQAIAFSSGQGGNIYVQASQQVDIYGSSETPIGLFSSGIVASSGAERSPFLATGHGGSLSIQTDRLTLSDGAQIAVNSFGTGDSGDITVSASAIQLTNAAQITAAASFGDGGNIEINNVETLLLRQGSSISTQAGSIGENGNGGNIIINADFVVGVPFEDSDIVAKAAQGKGGNITINTQGLYGFEERRSVENNGTNDIDASSEFGISGTAAINRVLSENNTIPVSLARQVVEASAEVSQDCGAAGNRFAATGRGGIPLQPDEMTESRRALVDWGESSYAFSNTIDRGTGIPTPEAVPPLSEADGWDRDSNNQVRLVVRTKNNVHNAAASCESR